MLRLLFFGFLLWAVNSHPIKDDNQNIDDNVKINELREPENIDELKKALNDVAYVQNFKNMMADYVKSQYNNLTENEMTTIKEFLEEFCHKFALDLKNIIENGIDDTEVVEKIEDGLPESTFENVRNCIKNELPGMKEATADHITFVLRKNLFLTRQKIDKVINDSKVAVIDNSK